MNSKTKPNELKTVSWEDFQAIVSTDDTVKIYIGDVTSQAVIDPQLNINLARQAIGSNQEVRIKFIKANLWRAVALAHKVVNDDKKSEHIMDLIESGNRGLMAFSIALKEEDLKNLEASIDQAILHEINHDTVRFI